MEKKLNLIMPMGGGGTRFGNHGFDVPKPLIEIYGKPFFYWAAQSIAKFVELDSTTFVVLKEHIEKFYIDKKIKEFYPNSHINVIPHVLKGAVLTCMEGIADIPEDAPIMFNDCDHLFLSNTFYDFCKKQEFSEIDAALLTFKSDDDKYSYAAYDEQGNVNKTVEKQVVSNDAICGAYYFKNKNIFSSSVEKYLTNCSYSEYFVSGVYNIMADEHRIIKSFKTDEHISFGTPDEFDVAKESKVFKLLK